ncbi:MAG: Hsp33 family molecular chaperone [Parvularculaceae bacterium]|nr:Hsp33 family molecular chaperone [Parvularculaceae bacterium]
MRDDLIIPFQVGDGSVRGRIVRLGAAIDAVLRPHGFSDAVSELLGEAAALTALMGAGLKFDGKLIFQAQGEGDVRLLVADYCSDGALRATASVRGGENARGLAALMGKGHIALTIDQGPDMDRYQGVTPIEGETLEQAAIGYFDQSEQIPTAVRLAVGKITRRGEEAVWRAGGVIAQFMPAEGGTRARGEAVSAPQQDRETWDRAAAFLNSTQADELLDPALSPEELLYRLYHEDGVRVFEARPVRAACGCNASKIAAVLARYSEEELADLAVDGAISVDCEFCRRTYLFDTQGREAAQ